VLAALAALTTRIRLATGILITPLRGAAVLAKTAATVDVLSGGRLDLGVGTGWQAEEYAAVGLDFSKRGQLLTDTLAACRALWRDSPAAVDLPTVQFSETWCDPKPVQPDGVPIWVSGTLLRPVQDRVVRFGAGWIPIMTATIDDIREGTAQLKAAFTEVGRDPSTLQVRGPLAVVRDDDKRVDIGATVAGVEELVDAGATDAHVPLQALSREPAEATELLRDLAAAFAAVTQ
jgi:probable F420-dependent oxidoreductase